MNQPTSVSARILAAAALIAAFVLAIAVIGGAFGDGDSDDGGRRASGGQAAQGADSKPKVPATYEIQSGDTLVAIAHRMGISVAQIEMLNPRVDPQILIAGETLKLR